MGVGEALVQRPSMLLMLCYISNINPLLLIFSIVTATCPLRNPSEDQDIFI